jgi:hypothetical protein
LSTASGFSNITLTREHVVVPELPELMTTEKMQILVHHQEQADRTLGALDAMMTRSLTTRQQHEFSLQKLLNNLEHDSPWIWTDSMEQEEEAVEPTTVVFQNPGRAVEGMSGLTLGGQNER